MPTNKSKYSTFKAYLLYFLRENAIVFVLGGTFFLKEILFNAMAWEIPHSIDIFQLVFIYIFFALLFFSPAIFIKKYKTQAAYTINIIFTLFLLADIIYIRYFNAMPSLSLLGALGENTAVSRDILSLLSFLDILLFADLLILPFFMKRLEKLTVQSFKPERRKYLYFRLLMFALTLLLGFGLFAHDFPRIKETEDTVSNGKYVISLYGAWGEHFFDIYRTYFIRLPKISEAEKQNIVNWIKKNTYKNTPNAMTGVAKNKNVIFLQVESLQNFVIGAKVEGQEVTPNLNKLLAQSHYFDNHYFEIGAGATSDSDLVANTSIYPLANESAFIKYGTRDYSSVAKELEKVGYSADAYHANNRGFWNRNVVFKSLGYQKFFAEDNYPKGSTVDMGLNDKDFLNDSIAYIKDQPKPSFSYLITLSSHFPFDIKDPNRTLKLSTNKYPTLSADYLQSIHYTDAAIGEFIAKLKAEGLYDDSLLVVYGDHYAKLDSFNYGGIKFDVNDLADKKVPLLIKLPGETKAVKHEDVSSHIDIMPTVLNLVGANSKAPMFGRDLFSSTEPFWGAVKYFDDQTIVDGDIRYRRFDASSEVCEQKIGGNWKKVTKDKCKAIINKKNELQDFSEKLLKYNLFNRF